MISESFLLPSNSEVALIQESMQFHTSEVVVWLRIHMNDYMPDILCQTSTFTLSMLDLLNTFEFIVVIFNIS